MNALDALLAGQPCFTLKDLAVNGRDLTALGLKGKAVGDALQMLLEAVMDGKTENDKDILLDYLNKELSDLPPALKTGSAAQSCFNIFVTYFIKI